MFLCKTFLFLLLLFYNLTVRLNTFISKSLSHLPYIIQVDSETHDPVEVEAKKIMDTNSMVEEFMLLANISVAQQLAADFPQCALLRRHPAPPPANFASFLKAAKQQVTMFYC